MVITALLLNWLSCTCESHAVRIDCQRSTNPSWTLRAIDKCKVSWVRDQCAKRAGNQAKKKKKKSAFKSRSGGCIAVRVVVVSRVRVGMIVVTRERVAAVCRSWSRIVFHLWPGPPPTPPFRLYTVYLMDPQVDPQRLVSLRATSKTHITYWRAIKKRAAVLYHRPENGSASPFFILFIFSRFNCLSGYSVELVTKKNKK